MFITAIYSRNTARRNARLIIKGFGLKKPQKSTKLKQPDDIFRLHRPNVEDVNTAYNKYISLEKEQYVQAIP